jgi:hypothetical protein
MSDDREIRLFDGQWANIVYAHDCWEGHTKEEAVNAAVKMAEEAMAKNMKENLWPNSRSTYSKESETMLSIMLLPL